MEKSDEPAPPIAEAETSRWAALRWDPLLLPGGLAFIVFLVFAALDAGWAPTVWYPGALFLLILAAVTLAFVPKPPVSRAAAASIALFTAYTAWSYLSIAWADVKGDAWDGSNRTLLYLVVYVLFVRLAWRAPTAALLLGGYALAVAVLGVTELARAASASDPTSSFFLLGRLNAPAGYQNADCALFLSALWPGLFLSSSRAVPIVARALLLAASGVVLELALLTQSRGSVGALPLVFLLYLGLVPHRARAILFALPPAAAVAVAAPVLLDVFPALRDAIGGRAAVSDARDAVVFSAVALVLLGLAAALVDRRLSLSPRAARAGSRVVVAAFAAAIVASLAVGAAAAGNPAHRIENAWNEFKNGSGGSSSSYFANGFGSNRYDIWRVALDEFREAPVRGIGADNFAVPYLRDRRTVEEPLYPHSLELRLLAQTGIVGTLLFAAFLAAALLQLAPFRRAAAFERGVATAAVALFGYWLIHGSVDWFWEVPGLAAPAFASLALAGGVVRRTPPRDAKGRPLALAAVGLLGCAALVSLAGPWLAAKEVQNAARSWRGDPEQAFRRLDRAGTLNPLNDRADLVAGAIASRLGDRERMRRYFERAADRNPHEWYAWLELGIVDSLEGRRRAALAKLARARALDPGEETIADVASSVRSGRRVSPIEIDERLLQKVAVDAPRARRR